MQRNPIQSSSDAQNPTYTAPGIAITVRVNGVPQQLSPESRARCLAWREGCVIDSCISGLIVRRAYSGRVIAKGFHGYQAVIDAYERGELGREVHV